MFETWEADSGLGESKESIIARGGVKISKGVFRLPDGSTVTPDSAADWVTSTGGGTIVTTHTPTAECAAIKARGNITPAEAGKCGWGYSGIYNPSQQPTIGLPKMDAGGTVGKPAGDTGMETAPPTGDAGGGLNLGFLSQPVFGIPLWMIAAGVGAVLLLKKR